MEPDLGRIFTSFDIQSWCRSNAISMEAISWIGINSISSLLACCADLRNGGIEKAEKV